MQKQAREIQYFFYSQAFADGFRASFAILLPALLGLYFDFFDIGLTISLGAMCVSLTDAPGPFIHRKNGMLIATGFAFIVAIITAFARLNIYTLGLEIALITFLFSMFNVYGARATGVGNAAILIMILTMDKPVAANETFTHALLIAAGGIFYTVLSLLLYFIRPYRIAQRALGDCIREIATFLSIKADFYNVNTALDENYRKMVAQQIVVNEKQDAVRELFFKTRQIVRESTREGRRLVFTFVETVDLFEDITAAYYDYALLRKQFEPTGALELINQTLKKISHELDSIGFAIQSNTSFTRSFNYDDEIRKLKSEIDRIAPKGQYNTLVLRKILVNIRIMLDGLNNINQYFEGNIQRGARLDHSHFVSHQSLDPKIIWNNLSMESSVFRHSLRVCIACMVGFIVAKIYSYGHHSYWILLTIAFILKPAFSLTKQRNIQRIIGTLAGGAIGVLILLFIPNNTAKFALMVLFMIATYSFMRINYLVMVICTTRYVLILFSFLGTNFKSIATERIYDTIIGCAIAFAASYILFSFLGTNFKSVATERIYDTIIGCAIAFAASYILFPHWESNQLNNYMKGILKANAAYLQKIIEALSGQKINLLEYKLARKDVYLNSANLSAAFQRMLSEPKSKQKGEKNIHQFVVLNHILFSNIATVATTLLSKDVRTHPEELVQLAKKAETTLQNSIHQFGEDGVITKQAYYHNSEPVSSNDDVLMKEQLNFINKVSADIDKTTKAIIVS